MLKGPPKRYKMNPGQEKNTPINNTWNTHRRTWNRMIFSYGLPLCFSFEEPQPVQVHVKDKGENPNKQIGSRLALKWQLQLFTNIIEET